MTDGPFDEQHPVISPDVRNIDTLNLLIGSTEPNWNSETRVFRRNLYPIHRTTAGSVTDRVPRRNVRSSLRTPHRSRSRILHHTLETQHHARTSNHPAVQDRDKLQILRVGDVLRFELLPISEGILRVIAVASFNQFVSYFHGITITKADFRRDSLLMCRFEIDDNVEGLCPIIILSTSQWCYIV